MTRREFISHLFKSCKNEIFFPQIHSLLLKTSFIVDCFFTTKLIAAYGAYISSDLARKLFEETPRRNVFLWNAIMRIYCRKKEWKTSLVLFDRMHSMEMESPDKYSISIALKACAGLLALKSGKTMHGFIEKCPFIGSDMFVGSALIDLYASCREIDDASRVFLQFSYPDVVLWTSMVTAYQRNGNSDKSLLCFRRMMTSDVIALDPVTMVSAISACMQYQNFVVGESFHGLSLKKGFISDVSVTNSLLNFYAKAGYVEPAQKLFDEMLHRDVISWSSMVSCYVQNKMAVEALDVFNRMFENGIEPNIVTVVSALQACSSTCDLSHGKQIHKFITEKYLEFDVTISTALIDMYMKCSCTEDAIDIFKRMPKTDIVTWAALIGGYAQNGLAHESIGLFCAMLLESHIPDAVTMVKVLDASSQLGILKQALCLHGYLVHSGFDDQVYIGAALIDLYSKCGSLNNATMVFNEMPFKDVAVWSSIISAYGIHGFGVEAIETFHQMIKSGIKPNDITYVSVLSACSHAGLVEDGISLFEEMDKTHYVKPNTEHYAIIVDLLGRMGKLAKAMKLIENMPIRASPHVWGSLLGACRIHHNIEMGEFAARKLVELDPNHAGYYVLLSNIYAANRKWASVAKVRALIREKKLRRVPGHSSIEVENKVHTFLVADRWHQKHEIIYEFLKKFEIHMREGGYISDLDFVLNEEDMIQSVEKESYHC